MPPEQDDWFNAIVTRYERPLLAYAVRHLNELEAARDAVQDVFLRLHAEIVTRQVHLETRLAPWLFTVCRNRCIDHQRLHAVSRKDSATNLSAFPSPTEPPGAGLERDESLAQVLAALELLPERQQGIIRLKFEQGLSYADIAALTRLSTSNVCFLLSTGLATLRHHIAAQVQDKAFA